MKALLKGKWGRRTYAQQKAAWGVIYVLPWLIGFVLFFFVPLLASLRYSLSSIQANAKGISIQFTGLANYIQALTVNTSFNRALIGSITEVFVNVPLIVIFSLFLAVILNQKFPGRAIARSIFFLPVILASGVIMALESTSLIEAVNQSSMGGSALGTFEIENLMLDAGLSEWVVMYLSSAVDRIYQIVSQSGVQILIFLAGIQTISPQLYEASKMEGATGYEAFWKITFPMVSPLIFVNVIYTIVDSFANNAMTSLIRDTGFVKFDFGLSSAMAWVYFVAIAVILIIVSLIFSKRVFYQD
ncbi:ABC-type sugar transport system, permease component [Paenibacillus sp. ov031]|uniref:carbohydrate ABC transporter permease n=1 Tax=Paenibacillus sp. ov031 TaxID=1761879 RepID=UPI000918434F|nr:sugar ABC transporter permease [Paenibacillus sp. ov031]SHN59733.1 ABC-type sugar transport system, permease component [Paenibacillus sp. ov031]